MARLRRDRDPVPLDLRQYDVERWQAAAVADPEPHGDWRRPTDLYVDAVAAAGVDEQRCAELRAAAVVATIKCRIAAEQ